MKANFFVSKFVFTTEGDCLRFIILWTTIANIPAYFQCIVNYSNCCSWEKETWKQYLSASFSRYNGLTWHPIGITK